MKGKILYAILLSFIFLSTVLYAGEPFAPVVDIPENPKNDADLALAIMIVKDVKVPDNDVVGVSAYPDAKIFQTTQMQGEMLPAVRLLSTDDIEKVLKHYKDELKDWKYKEFYGIHYLFNGDEQKAMFGMAPVVQLEDAEKFTNIMATAKTVITIGYDSGDKD
jgi:hypothetical protein